MKKIKWYTLLEVIMSIVIFSLLVGSIISIYINIKTADGSVAWKRLIISEASDLFDSIHEAAIDYTIDYEEYFNKENLCYSSYYDCEFDFSSYGNSWERYYCVSWLDTPLPITPQWYRIYPRDNNNYGCISWWYQKYWEYDFQHWKLITWWNLNSIENSWANQRNWPIAINNNTWLSYLYLISNDKTERYYIRRVQDENSRWKIQALRLVWFDAWSGHDFDSWWAFDWFIDTRACDTAKWFICQGNDLDWYKLPVSDNDWWVDVTSYKVNVKNFTVDVFPKKDPYLAKYDDNELMDPYIKISITLSYWDEENDKLTLSTTLSLKNTYSNFSNIE